jgi:hypothetical protein
VKLSIFTAILALAFGIIIVIAGALLNFRGLPLGNPTILGGLGVNFLGTILLVLGLHQRKRKN